MKIKTTTFTLLLMAAILAIILSCAKYEIPTAELRFGFTTEPKTLDPLNPDNTADGRSILFNVFEGLVKPNTDGTFKPCIAESWTIENNALVYIFTLREGVQFHDGSFVTADDVKFSIDTAIAANFYGLEKIDTVNIQGNQIQVILKSADPDFLPYMTVGIVKAGNTQREKDITGTGPFYIESYTSQKHLLLKRFDNYWQRFLEPPNEVPYLESVTIVFFANFDPLMTSLRSGNIDGAWLTGTQIAQLDQNNFDFFYNYSSAVQMLALNNAASPLDDINIRKAVNYGIDVQEIIDAAFFGRGSHSGSPIIPGLSAYYEESLEYPFEPETARTLLENAGFNRENPFNFEITVPSNYIMHVDTAQVIAHQLKNIGINAAIKLVDWSTWLRDVYRERNYQATIISVDSSVVTPGGFLNRYYSGNGNNFINFANDDFDSVYNSLLTQSDSETRNQLYREAQRIITNNAASVFIQDILYYNVFKKDVYAGAENYPLYVIDFSTIYRINEN